MNRHIKKICLGLLFMGVSFGCDSDFEEINTNPNDPLEAPPGFLMANVMRVSANILYNMQIGGEMGATWAQQWSMVQYNDPERFAPRQTSIEGLWDAMYASVISDAKSMAKLAEEQNEPELQGIALIMQAYSFQILTDMYGAIPFSEAGLGGEGNFTPVYDSQEAVYNGILAMLDQAESLLASGDATLEDAVAPFDLVYKGDVAGWRKFGNSLKFRALMRVSGKKDVAAQLQALMSKPMFSSNDDDADLEYLSAQPNANPIYETIVFGVREEWKVSDIMVNTLANNNDPRLEVYVAENSEGEYRGKPVGLKNVPSDDYNYNNVSGIGEFYLKPEREAFFMSYPELMFLIAEAAHRDLITADPATYYQKGIEGSMKYNGIAEADYTTFLAANAYNAGAGLQQISVQKWIALFGQGLEAYSEWRRTGIPALSTPIDSYIPSGYAYRFTYPSTEQTTNRANYQAAVAAQGADLLTTKVWWMN
jgi:hypothetical protein